MRAWSQLLDDQVAQDLADGRREPLIRPRSKQPVYQGCVRSGDVLGEVLAVEEGEAGAVAAAVAAVSQAPHLPLAVPTALPPWPPKLRMSGALALEGTGVVMIPKEQLHKILLQFDGSSLFRSDYLVLIASKLPSERYRFVVRT